MKTFRLIGMALLAVVMCLNFTSCSDDDEEPERNDDGIVTNQKRLVRISSDAGDIAEFIYDSKGRVSTIFDNDYTFNYTWGDGVITETPKNGRDEDFTTYSLNKNSNLIRSSLQQRSLTTYTYNSSNQLIEIKDEYSITHTYIWEEDRIVKIIETERNNDDTIYEYIYSGKKCKGYLPLYEIFISNGVGPHITYTHPELIGLRCTQLPDQMTYRHGNYSYTEKYTYTFDKDGYLESCTTTDEDNSHSYVDTFTWE